MIVIDVGCKTYPAGPANEEHESITALIERFHPSMLYGYDPLLEREFEEYEVGDTVVKLARLAAWTYDGVVEMALAGRTWHAYDSTVMRAKNSRNEWAELAQVPCFDLSAEVSLLAAAAASEVVVKLDCEGAEFALLEKMADDGTDRLCTLLMVEWHHELMEGYSAADRDRLLERLRCPVEEIR